MMTKLTRYVLLSFLFSGCVHAEAVEIIGSIKLPIISTNQGLSDQSTTKSIALLNIKLSKKAKQIIHNRVEQVRKDSPQLLFAPTLPKQVQLGMNNVPVMDQGSHGTCATFANTAAIDAVLNKGDYISQLCQLELGRYLENRTYTWSGWNGSWGPVVLNQMSLFGVVSKANQQTMSCAGLTEYPMGGNDPMEEIDLSDFHQMSDPMPDNQVAWTALLEPNQAVFDQPDMNTLINEVKKSLNAGDRLTFGVLLVDFNQGMVGAVGRTHANNDSWILTPEIAADINEQTQFAGHEMIITGYDDNAFATDNKGRKYIGLFTLRNSWGTDTGYNGEFYMSYTYFKALGLELQRIRHLKSTN